MRCLLLLAVLACFCGCPREPGSLESDRAEAAMSYPWQFRGSRAGDLQARQAEPAAQPEEQAAVVEQFDTGVPASARPAFSSVDTFDTRQMYGAWLQCVGSNVEEIRIGALSEMDVIQFAPGRKLTYHSISGEKRTQIGGEWDKIGPGRARFSMEGNEPNDVSIEFFGNDIFFFWDDNLRVGYWFSRISETSPERIEASRFDTTFGEVHLSNIVSNSFEGTVSGENERIIGGVYIFGTVLLQWEEPTTGSSGYAIWHVSGDWSSFKGTWWLNDPMAAPFGGEWNGTALNTSAPPAAGDQVVDPSQ